MTGPTIAVFADSLAFHGPADPMPADDPRLWPNIAAAELGGQALLFAAAGWTAREAFWALTGDPNVWASMPKIDAIVLAVGSMDTLPSPVPTYLRVGLRYLRPAWLRRWAREKYRVAQPKLARLTDGRPVGLPPSTSVAYLDDFVRSVWSLRPDLPIVGILPPTHRSADYGFVHTGYAPAVAALRNWGARRGVPQLDLLPLTRKHVLGGQGNPDGIHWGWPAHTAVGVAMAGLLAEVFRTGIDRVSAVR
jgi:hypothetical protein